MCLRQSKITRIIDKWTCETCKREYLEKARVYIAYRGKLFCCSKCFRKYERSVNVEVNAEAREKERFLREIKRASRKVIDSEESKMRLKATVKTSIFNGCQHLFTTLARRFSSKSILELTQASLSPYGASASSLQLKGD